LHDRSAAVSGKWEQADAALLLESGWTQERIAKKIGKTQQWVAYQLRFAAFLNYYRGSNRRLDALGASIPSTLTERAFRLARLLHDASHYTRGSGGTILATGEGLGDVWAIALQAADEVGGSSVLRVSTAISTPPIPYLPMPCERLHFWVCR
jgi:hypothetical protein